MSIASLAYIDETGFHYSDYPSVLEYLQTSYRSIYGQDVYLEPDSQDGQWVAIQAAALYDVISLAAATYNSYSPSTSQKDALSRNVKINGLARKVPSKSSVDVVIVGQVGTTITDGIVQDINGGKWILPDNFTIPPSGTVTVTATAELEGSVQAPEGSVTKIFTPTRGWQSVNNPDAGSVGAPVESDPELRLRQSDSSALPSRTVIQGIQGAIANITGVTRFRVYENDTKVTDSDGLPGNSICAVVEGGDSAVIANTIAIKKTPGGYTFGDIAVDVTDSYGLPMVVRLSRPDYDSISAAISVKALAGYSTDTRNKIKAAVVAYIKSVSIGGGVSKSVEWADAITAANSVGGGITYKIIGLTLTGPGGPGSPDVPVAFDHAADSNEGLIVLTET